MKLEFYCQIFEKFKYQISPKSVQWEPSRSTRTDGWTGEQADRHNKANIRFSQFYERA